MIPRTSFLLVSYFFQTPCIYLWSKKPPGTTKRPRSRPAQRTLASLPILIWNVQLERTENCDYELTLIFVFRYFTCIDNSYCYFGFINYCNLKVVTNKKLNENCRIRNYYCSTNTKNLYLAWAYFSILV